MKDLIREYLEQKGCAEHVVKGGLEGLIETWEVVVNEVAHGYDLTLDDYLNDMDGRQLIEEVIPHASKASHKALIKKLHRLDAILKTLVEPRENSLWGNNSAQEHGWTREKHWWYFSQPKQPGPDLRAELEQ
jgi:hypothetical protein